MVTQTVPKDLRVWEDRFNSSVYNFSSSVLLVTEVFWGEGTL